MGQFRRLGDEGKGDESRESMGLVLQLTELQEVIDPVGGRLDVTVKHGGRAPLAHLVPGAVHLDPLLSRLLATADGVADSLVEDFSPSPGQGIEPSAPEDLEGFLQRLLEDSVREMAYLNGGESLEMNAWGRHLHGSEQFQIPRGGKCRV